MKKLLVCLTTLMCCLFVNAAQKLTINGEIVEKAVYSMTFDGDNVILTFSDQTSQTVDMSNVVITFDAATTDIYSLKMPVGSKLDIDGLSANSEISIYNAAGKMVLKTKAERTSQNLSTEGLKSGVYILKAGNKIVKFVKK